MTSKKYLSDEVKFVWSFAEKLKYCTQKKHLKFHGILQLNFWKERGTRYDENHYCSYRWYYLIIEESRIYIIRDTFSNWIDWIRLFGFLTHIYNIQYVPSRYIYEQHWRRRGRGVIFGCYYLKKSIYFFFFFGGGSYIKCATNWKCSLLHFEVLPEYFNFPRI